MTSIGMNLARVNYYTDEEPFIDRFKTSGVWTYQTGGSAPLDANGNPISLPAGVPYVGITFSVDTVSDNTPDEYVLTYDGTAKIYLPGVTVVSSTPGKIVFDVTKADKTSVFLEVTSMSASDPINNIHVVRADQMDLYNAGEIFNPAFVAKVAQWGMVRFMDWENINSSAPVSWDARSKMADSSWASGDHADGVPLEVMVKLANEAHTDMWYNIPTQADDTYVRNAMAYIKANLDPSLKVHVEYSNEVWNAGFTAATYARAQANALWGVDANHDGTIDPNDPAEAVKYGNLVYYGYRSAQIAAIAHDVFGDQSDARLVDVLAGQQANVAASNNALKGVALANVGSVSSLFDDYAITTYFGSELASTTPSDQATVIGWAQGGAAGLDAAFHELQYGGSLTKNYSLSAVAQYYMQAENFAKANGLNMVAYEGGASFISLHFPADVRDAVTAFFGELMNDPRMGDLYTQMISDFSAAGGDALVAYADVSANSQYGYWGVLDDIYDTGSPRYDALAAAAAGGTLAASDSAASSTAPHVNYLNGTAGNDKLVGTAGIDVIDGGAGNDTIDGGAGADQMYGGLGNDIYIVDNVGDLVVENANAGTDEVRTTLAAYTLGANVENLTSLGTGAFTGTGNDLDNVIKAGAGDSHLYGGAGNDSLYGGAGNDYIDGGTGADWMSGGAGNDIYIVDDTGDFVFEAANGGTDEVRTTLAKYSLGTNVENLTYTGTGAFIGNGNNDANVITGGAGDDQLLGGGGNDTLIGGAGNDKLQGGTGADIMKGGAGDDTYWVDDAGDQVIENADEGNDLVYASISYRLPANVETLVMTGAANMAWANDQGSTITGTSAGDHIYGGRGDDVLNGMSGDDFLYSGGGHDSLTGGMGADTFVFMPGDLVPDLTRTATITDFTRTQLDKIDLSAIDANSLTKADDAFTFLGTAAFTKHAGELRVVKDGSNYDVLGDTNGDGVADFALVVTSKSGMLVASDFLL